MSELRKEILRKLFHLSELLVIAAYTLLDYFFSPQVAILGLTALLLLLLEIEYIRIDYQTRVGAQITEFFERLLILRKHEKRNITGTIFLVITTIIAFSAFDFRIALLALLLTVFGDLAAAIMGIAFGSKKIFRNKSYVGTLSGFVVNVFLGTLLIPGHPEVFLPMAFTASVVEVLTQKLDDNLTVPLFAGFMGQLIIFASKISLPPLF